MHRDRMKIDDAIDRDVTGGSGALLAVDVLVNRADVVAEMLTAGRLEPEKMRTRGIYEARAPLRFAARTQWVACGRPVDPVSRTPTKPIDYAALSAGYGALTGALLVGRAGAKAVQATALLTELPVMGLATFALAKLVAKEKVESWVREPFLEERPDGGATAEGSADALRGRRAVVVYALRRVVERARVWSGCGCCARARRASSCRCSRWPPPTTGCRPASPRCARRPTSPSSARRRAAGRSGQRPPAAPTARRRLATTTAGE